MIKFSQRFFPSAGRYTPSLSTLPKVHRSENFKTLLVGGFSVPESEINHAARELCSDIHDLPPTSKKKCWDKAKAVVDSSTSLRNVEQNDVNEVLRFISSAGECNDGCATCAIFAHGHGAKVVAKAFEEETIDEFLRKHPDTTDTRCNILKKMQENVAVFTLGAIENLRKDCAKLCVNFQLDTDSMSYLGKRLFGTQPQINGTVLSAEIKKPPEKITLLGHLLRFASVVHCDHSLRDYLSAESIMNEIRQSLRPQEDKDCRCSGAQAKSAPTSRE